MYVFVYKLGVFWVSAHLPTFFTPLDKKNEKYINMYILQIYKEIGQKKWAFGHDTIFKQKGAKKMSSRLLEMFVLYFPFEEEHIVTYKEISPFEVQIEMDDGRYIMYNDLNHSIRQLPDDDKNLTEAQFRTEFSYRLRNKMMQQGLTQFALAERIGTSPSQLSHYLTHRNIPSFYMIDKIAKALGCTIDELTYRL